MIEWNDDDDNIVQCLYKYSDRESISKWIENVETILKKRCLTAEGTFTKISKLPLNSETGMSILHTAMMLKVGRAMIEMMCKYIGDIDCRNRMGSTPYHVGMSTDHTDGLDVLDKNNADINARDNDGMILLLL